MKKLRFNNTYAFGTTTFVFTKEGDDFVGVCLEFDLMVKGKTRDEVEIQLRDYANAWLENARKHKLPEEVLNRPAPKKYWKIYQKLLADEQARAGAQRSLHSLKPLVTSFKSPYDHQAQFATLAFA